MRPVYQKEANKFKAAPIPNSAIESQAKILTLKAFETYDPLKSQLNTHVTNHLKHLQRYVLEYQNIGKIPEHRGLAIGKYQTVFDNLKEDLGREPTDMELADNLGWSTMEIGRMQSELRKDLMMNTLGDEEDLTDFFDFSFNNDSGVDKEALQYVYFDADYQGKKILERFFGMHGHQQKNVSEIAQELGISEYYVRTKAKELAKEIKETMDDLH